MTAEQLVEEVVDEAEDEDEKQSLELRYSITSYGADYTVDSLVKRLNEDAVFIPPFQRKFVWTKAQASRFVESLLLGLPVPGIFLAKEPETQRLLVIDGQQRLLTLKFFYEGAFDRQVFELTGVGERFRGKTYKNLTEPDRRRLNDSIIHATIVKQDQPQDDNSSVYLLFERLNTGGTLLHPQEIRACVNHGAFGRELARLNANPAWRAIYGLESRRMKDQELILRFFALYFDFESYSRPMKEALNRYMRSNRNCERQDAKTLEYAFSPTIELVARALGPEAFRPAKALNAAVFDSVMVGLARRLVTGKSIQPATFKAAYLSLLQRDDFRAAFGKSTSDERQVRQRIDLTSSVFAAL